MCSIPNSNQRLYNGFNYSATVNISMSETYIGTTQAACRLHLSVQRVRKLAVDGRIEGAFKEGGRWKIPVSSGGMPKTRQIVIVPK